MCIDCADVAMKLRPGKLLGRLIEIKGMEAKAASISEDPTFPAEMDHAMRVRNGELPVPQLCPATNIFMQGSYGFRVKQEFGALTDQEFRDLVERAPSAASLKPIELPWNGPSANITKLFLVHLDQLAPELVLGMRRVELFYDNCSTNQEVYLSPQTQFNQNQADFVWKHIFERSKTSRPDPLRPGADPPPTVEEVQAKCDAAEEKQRLVLAGKDSLAEKFLENQESDADSDEPPGAAVGMGAGSLATAKKATRKPGAGAGAKSRTQKLQVAQNSLHQKLQLDDEVASSSKKGRTSSAKKTAEGNPSCIATLDEEMRNIAQNHLGTSKGSGIKSLENLIPFTYLTDGSNARAQASYIRGVSQFCFRKSCPAKMSIGSNINESCFTVSLRAVFGFVGSWKQQVVHSRHKSWDFATATATDTAELDNASNIK